MQPGIKGGLDFKAAVQQLLVPFQTVGPELLQGVELLLDRFGDVGVSGLVDDLVHDAQRRGLFDRQLLLG